MKFVLVSPGTFLMGSPEYEEGRSENERQHQVTVTNSFYMATYPVTQFQWQEVMGRNPSYFSSSGGGRHRVRDMYTDDFPVESVFWEEIQNFLRILGGRKVEQEAGLTYRLPTEAEWEYACRGGPGASGLPFHFGTPTASLSSRQANFAGHVSPYGGALEGPFLGRTCKVGSYVPNALGLHDMHGNVFEWCHDWYGDYEEGSATDPRGPSQGTDRVLRGGSWGSTGSSCRAAARLKRAPADLSSNIGFRIVALLDER